MLRALTSTRNDIAYLILRLVLAGVMFPHGAQKALGWFGGQGFSSTVDTFKSMGISSPLAMLVIAVEFLGSIALFLGLFTRIAALGIAVVMAEAIRRVHLEYGFFMNWNNNQFGEGYEYHILAIGIAFVLLIRGAGPASFDLAMSKKGG